MSNPNQCFKCGRDSARCTLQDDSNYSCEHFLQPRNNANMFRGFFSWEGRYSRAQYLIAVLIATSFYFIVGVGGAFLLGYINDESEISVSKIIIYSIASALIPTLIIIVAGIKRTHDIGLPWYWSVLVVIPFWWGNVFTILLGGACFFYLLKDESMEEINEHGASPVKPYESQLEWEE